MADVIRHLMQVAHKWAAETNDPDSGRSDKLEMELRKALDYYCACDSQNMDLLEAIGYPHEKNSLTSPEEYAAELKRKATLWNLIESMWSFPGQTLGELVQRIAKERAAGVTVPRPEAIPWKLPPYPATPTEREALAKRQAALGVGGTDGR